MEIGGAPNCKTAYSSSARSSICLRRRLNVVLFHKIDGGLHMMRSESIMIFAVGVAIIED